jgi:Tfp pilus assembly protein PilN
MPQQINLCTAAFKPNVQRFAAATMLPLLGACVAVGALLSASWVWNLDRSATGYRQTLDTQGGEIQSLQAAIQRSRAAALPVDPALVQELQKHRAEVQQREKILEVVQQGMFQPGEGHSDRMLLVARTIPAPAWVTTITMDAGRFEISGFTLEPDALTPWLAQLNASPLMRNLKLSSVKVESSAVVSGAVAPTTGRPAWAFNLVSLEPPVPVLALNAHGGKP